MLTYILRRILFMFPTLIGITIMVFLIVRFAPGSPGSAAVAGSGGEQMDAEGRKKLLEDHERRFGLNLPLHQQYFRWWRNMFVSENQAKAWTDDFKQIYTPRSMETEYFAFDPATSNWHQLISFSPYKLGDTTREEVSPEEAIFTQTDDFYTNTIPENANVRSYRLEQVEGFPDPRHVFVDAETFPIETLDFDLLIAAPLSAKIGVDAMVWSNFGGVPIYIDAAHDDRLVYFWKNNWYQMEPNRPEERWDIFSQDDPSFRSKIPNYFSQLPAIKKHRPIPRHAVVSGKPLLLEDAQLDASAMQRKTVIASASIDAHMWLERDGGLWPVYSARPSEGVTKQDVQFKIVQGNDGTWSRLIGDSRLVEPSFQHYEAGDFAELVPEGADFTAPVRQDGDPMAYYATMSGTLVPMPEGTTFDKREIRRYSHPISVFEVTLGRSITSHTTVVQEMKTRLWVTLKINILAFIIIYIVAIPTGMLMAMKRGKLFDTGSNVSLLALWSVPSVLSATLFIGYLAVGGNGFEIFPSNGLTSNNYDELTFLGKFKDQLWHLVLPVTCSVYAGFAYLSKQMRASMLENFTMDYVRTAKAKGVSQKNIVFVHVLRNSMIPLITIVATILPAMITGSVIIEKIFNIEGMGLFTFSAVQNRDFDVVQSMALIAGVLNLTGLLLADICYAIVDPRIAYK